MTHTPLVEVTQACLIRSVILDRLVSVTIITNLFVPDSIFVKSQLIEIMHGKGIGITVSIIFNTFCSFPSGLYSLTLEKTYKKRFGSVPSSGIFWKHSSKLIQSVSSLDQIS